MELSDAQKKMIAAIRAGDFCTIGGPAAGEEIRYEVQRFADGGYKVTVYDRLVRLAADYVQSPDGVIRFIEAW